MNVSDNVKRGVRTAIQAALGVMATGGLSKVWESYSSNNPVDPTIQVGMGLFLIAAVGWAQNTLEDNFGGGILLPEDRVVGDVVLGEGLGEKQLRQNRLSRSAEEAILVNSPAAARAVRSGRHFGDVDIEGL